MKTTEWMGRALAVVKKYFIVTRFGVGYLVE